MGNNTLVSVSPLATSPACPYEVADAISKGRYTDVGTVLACSYAEVVEILSAVCGVSASNKMVRGYSIWVAKNR